MFGVGFIAGKAAQSTNCFLPVTSVPANSFFPVTSVPANSFFPVTSVPATTTPPSTTSKTASSTKISCTTSQAAIVAGSYHSNSNKNN
jgi:hypothetical protein